MYIVLTVGKDGAVGVIGDSYCSANDQLHTSTLYPN